MNLNELNSVARAIVAKQKGVLAADESSPTIKNDKGDVIAPVRFTQNGNRRKISLVIPVSRDEQPETQVPPSPKELREQQANGISETRVVVAGVLAALWLSWSDHERHQTK